MSRVSAVIPVYNRAQTIGATIANLLGQSRPPDEIVVVDDGSTDSSLDIIRSFGDKVRVITQTNQGPGAARNVGIAAACGEYLQFQDSDDLLSLNKIEDQAHLLDTTGAEIALGPWAHVTINDGKVVFQTHVLQQRLPALKTTLAGWMLRGWTTVVQSMLFRRSAVTSDIRFRTDIRYGEDMEFLFRLLLKQPKVVFTPDVLTLYNVHDQNRLSSDTEVSLPSRIVDWAQCLWSFNHCQRLAAVNMNAVTRWTFIAGIRKHLRYLRRVPSAPPALVTCLLEEVDSVSGTWLAIWEILLRITERIRLLRFGSRWMPAYCASSITSQQGKLIESLGLQIVPFKR